MSKYSIPSEYERYNSVVDKLVDEYITMVEEDLVVFDSNDLMALLALLGKTFNRLREVVDDMKEVADTDKVSLYSILLGLIIEKSVMASAKLTADQKEQVTSAFGENGIFQSLLGMFTYWFNSKLKDMDTNNDKKVTKEEYQTYLFDKNKKNCGCMGDESNLNAAKWSANCCFPILSGGDGVIDLEDDNAE